MSGRSAYLPVIPSAVVASKRSPEPRIVQSTPTRSGMRTAASSPRYVAVAKFIVRHGVVLVVPMGRAQSISDLA